MKINEISIDRNLHKIQAQKDLALDILIPRGTYRNKTFTLQNFQRGQYFSYLRSVF